MNKKELITKDIVELFNVFDDNVRLVGGCVRDYLLGKKVNDYDLATPLCPKTVISLLKQNDIPVYPTGLKHGTVTAVYKGIPYEITTLRRDISSDGRHADVAFVDSYATDAHRRDFTVNALYMDKAGNISDYTNGLKDLSARRIRFIGEANARVQEDFLRILRYFRFLALFGTKRIDEESLSACRIHKNGLCSISVERIRAEMMKLLMGRYVINSLNLMQESGVLSVILPKADVGRLATFLKSYPRADSLMRLSALVDSPQAVAWKWSKAERKQLGLYGATVQIGKTKAENRYLLWKIGKPAYLFHLHIFQLNHSLSELEFQKFKKIKMPVFTIRGSDLYNLGWRGAEIHRQMQRAEEFWVELNFSRKKRLVIEKLLSYNEKKPDEGKDKK